MSQNIQKDKLKERRNNFLRSFQVKPSLFFLSLISALFIVALGAVFYFLTLSRLEEIDKNLSVMCGLAEIVSKEPETQPQALPSNIAIQLYDQNFVLLKSYGPHNLTLILPEEMRENLSQTHSSSSISFNTKSNNVEKDSLLCLPLYKDSYAYHIYRIRVQKIRPNTISLGPTHYLVLIYPMTNFFQAKIEYYVAFASIWLLFVLFMALWWGGLHTKIKRELHQLRNAIKSIDIDKGVHISSTEQIKNPYIQEIVKELNSLFARIEEVINGLLTFTADASHELRTPLAIIKGIVDVTLLKPREIPHYQRKLRELGAHADKMQSLLTALLEMARLEGSGEQMKMESLELMVIGEEVSTSLKPIFESKKQLLKLRLNPAPIKGNEALINQLITNLLDNASKYTHQGGSITVITDHDLNKNEAMLEVWDTGIGMDEETINRCFNRLWRAEKSRTTPGYGLGLSLGMRIIRIHGGRVEIESKPNKGTKIKVFFPLDLDAFEAYGLS